MKIGIGLPTQIRDVDAAVIPRWASCAEDAHPAIADTDEVGKLADAILP
jgi:hypothetical protein